MLLALAACTSTDEVAEDGRRTLTRDELEQLVAEGAIAPVSAPGDAEEEDAWRAGMREDDELTLAEERLREAAEAAPAGASGTGSTGPASGPASGQGDAQRPATDPPVEGDDVPPELADLASLAASAGEVAEPEPPAENPYLAFGRRIIVYEDQGLIAKPFPLRPGTGQKLQELIETYGNFPLWKEADGAQLPDQVRIDLAPGWDVEIVSDLRQPVWNEGKTVPVADWLWVVTGPRLLHAVERFINNFAAGVPQIEIEAKIVEVTTTDSLALGVTPIDSSTPIFGFPDGTLLRSFDYNFPAAPGSNVGSLVLGAVQDELVFNAVIQALASYENVSITSQPKIAVREGARAEIVNTKKIPTYALGGLNASGNFSASLVFEQVGVQLYVVPRVVGTETVALNIDIEASQESGTSVSVTTAEGVELSNPVITSRSARTIVYLEPGQAVIIGGLLSERNVERQEKVPVLGDIPILGNFFRSTQTLKETSNVLFFIRPRILQGSDLHRDF